jgi:DNA repair exonuclease SbcCD ATPase subunit
MWIKRLIIHNWMSFRGETVLDLEPEVYGLHARHTKDPGRSNFLGKSALLESIYFALTGKLNPDRHLGADGWVSDGEKEGSVTVIFNNGSVLRRERKKTTQIYFDKAKGDEAQQLVDQRIGLTPDDFLATCYFQQRQMARLVLADPGERMRYVRAWFQLEPLERAEDILRDEASRLVSEIEQCNGTIRNLKEVETREGRLETLTTTIQTTEKELALLVDREERLSALVQQNERLIRIQEQIHEREQVRSELRESEPKVGGWEEVQSQLVKLRGDTTRARVAHSDAHRRLDQKRRLSLKQFDGHCPVAEMKCPVTKELNAQTSRNAKLVTEAEEELEVERAKLSQKEKTEAKVETAMQEIDRIRLRVEELQKRDAKLSLAIQEEKEMGQVMDRADLQARLSRTSQQVGEKRTELRRAQEGLGLVTRALSKAIEYKAKLDAYEKELQTHREAIVIFGKQGAQRRVAEPALREIQNGGNAMLRECSIPLDFEISWSREGAGPAKVCDSCGQPFPASRQVKECSRCKTPRGQLLVNKLDLILSEQSGAAEDLIGAAIQLAASAWLRRRRGSVWSTALLDEPAGQLDETHRAAFAAHLSALLGTRYGFEQAIVTAHHRSFLEALPGRIEIVHDGKRASAKVVA